jgi:hypothetical protein
MNKITTVLNVYKRPQYLSRQIESIENQTIPSDIWIDYTVPKGKQMWDLNFIAPNAQITTRINQNFYHIGRFFYALNAQTEYVFICDDDILPGKNYLQHCINIIENEGDCVLTGYGLRFDRNIPRYQAVETYGWHSLPDNGFNESKEVDMAGHSWFMKKSTLLNITREIPYSYKNGEDLFFSYIVNKYAQIPIKVPPHNINDPHNWSCNYKLGWEMGNDEHATWRLNDHLPIRNETIKYYLNKGWKLTTDKK